MENYINKLIQQNKTPSWNGIALEPFLPTHPLNCKPHKFSIKDGSNVKNSNNSIRIQIFRTCDILEYITVPSGLVPTKFLFNDQAVYITDSMLVKRSGYTKIDMNSFPLMLCPYTFMQIEYIAMDSVDNDYTITQTGFYIQLKDDSETLDRLYRIDPTIEFNENYDIYFYGGVVTLKERVPKRLSCDIIDTDLQNKKSRTE